MAAFFLALPFKTNGGQIYKGDMSESGWNWTPVVVNGFGNKLNYGVRQFAVVGDYLYGVTGNHVTGFEIWRTRNGITWQIIMRGGFGDCSNTSGRGLTAFNGYLYVGVENRKTGAKIFRRKIDANGDFAVDSNWEQVVNDGLGDIGNYWFSDFVQYGGDLYTGTLNPLGMQLWRTSDGVMYENIFKNGNRFIGNTAIMKLYVFKGKLYFGTMNFFKGASLWVNNVPAPDIVDGDSFSTVFTEGNGNRFNFYVWSMQEFNNRLYVGTFDSVQNGFDLFSSVAPGESEWFIETDNGFGYDGYYGIRSMTVIDDKLIIGTATASKQLGSIIFQGTSGRTTTDDDHHKKVAYNYTNTDYYYMKQMVCKDINITLKQINGVKQFCA